jgi:TIR domain/AAA ATPase domain
MSFFLSSADKPAVEELARRLTKEGIQAWLDKWNLIPGDPWQAAIEKALAESETCAVFVGPSGFGPWQNEEMRAAIDQRVRDSGKRFRVIPVLLPGAKRAERSSLPTFLAATTWVEFRDSLDDQDAFHRVVCGIRGVEPGASPGQAIYEGQCPYRGLRVFDVGDAPLFFGREALVQWLLNELRPASEGQPVNRFLAIVGASGSGKSSVARAGLVAALKQDAIPGSAGWPVTIFRSGPDPVESLAVALSRALNLAQSAPALAELIETFKKNEKTLHLIARQSLSENASAMRLVILVDQFEEVFTLSLAEDLREALIRNLLYAAKVAQGQTLVILTMRADFYPKCATNAQLAAALSDHHVLVGPMSEDELRRAIERPMQLVGGELEGGLVDLLLRDVRHQAGALPLLQHALLELWHKREGRRLTLKTYQEIGKLEGALQRRADATLEALSERELCRRTFLRLTQPGEGTEDTKRRASVIELLSLADTSTAEESIIQKLANASLLTTEGDFTNRDAFVEVAHEALIRNWPQLRKWIDVDRAGLRTRSRLTEAARDWKNSGRDPAYLHTGARLAVAKEWEGNAEKLEIEFDEKFQRLATIRDELLEAFGFWAGEPATKAAESIGSSFERLLPFKFSPDPLPPGGWLTIATECLAVFLYELFLRTIGRLLSLGAHATLTALLKRVYVVPTQERSSWGNVARFTIFYTHSEILQNKKNRQRLNRYDLLADSIKERCGTSLAVFQSVMEADLLLALRSILHRHSYLWWYPRTLIYSTHRVLPLFARAEQHQQFQVLCELVGVTDKQELQQSFLAAVQKEPNLGTLFSGSWNPTSLAALINLERLDTIP